MRPIWFCVVLLVFVEPAYAQDVAQRLQEAEYQAVQSLKITWASRASEMAQRAEQMKTNLQRIRDMAVAANIDVSSCRDAEFSQNDTLAIEKIHALLTTFDAASTGERTHFADLQSQYAASNDYAQKLVLYDEQISSQTKIKMYGIILPPLIANTDFATDAVKNACLLRRFKDPGSQTIRNGIAASEAAEDLFLAESKAFDVTFNFIGDVRL
jgi:hypothetical protein